MATPFLPGVIVLPAWKDDRVGVAKRARDEDLLAFLEEADARGWSSSVLERSFTLRRRRAPASSSSPKDCDWAAFPATAATAEEHGCRREEAAAIGSGAVSEEKVMADTPCFRASRSNRDSVAFDPTPMATPLLPLCAFITNLFKARKEYRVGVAKRAREVDLSALSEEIDACGWCSSEVPERRLVPRRRRGSTTSSSRWG